MSDEKFGCICVCFLFLVIAGVIAAVEVYKVNHGYNRVIACPCQTAEACPCQKK